MKTMKLLATWPCAVASLAIAVLAPSVATQAPPGPAVQQAYIKPSAPDQTFHFGHSVAMSGDTLIVGAPDEGPYHVELGATGAAYVFLRTPQGLSQQAHLAPPVLGKGGEFGTSVAISRDTLVVSEPFVAVGGLTKAGQVHVFERSGAAWVHVALLTASNPGAGDEFGQSLSLSGDTLAVAARNEDSSATGVDGDQANDGAFNAGAVYVFVRDAGAWQQQAYLKASNANASDRFGESVSLDLDTLVVGALDEDSSAKGVNGDQAVNSCINAGAAYVFVRSGTTWTQQAYLKASNTEIFDGFGTAVAVSGDTIAVCAAFEESNSPGVNGNQANNNVSGAGAVYVFTRSGSSWSQQAYVKAAKPGVGDNFGRSLAALDDVLVVGVASENSLGYGVDGATPNVGALESGAAYVFTRVGGSWSQLGYLKSSFTKGGAAFGQSVAVSGSTCVVGSPGESGTSPGVNGDQTLLEGSSLGAAYAFTLDPGPWTDLTFGLTGTAGVPVARGEGPLTADSANALQLASARPSSLAMLGVGTQYLVAFFKQGTFVPDPVALVPLATDALGVVSVPFHWPVGVPAGSRFYVQFWIDDPGAPAGWAASNALEGVAH